MIVGKAMLGVEQTWRGGVYRCVGEDTGLICALVTRACLHLGRKRGKSKVESGHVEWGKRGTCNVG